MPSTNPVVLQRRSPDELGRQRAADRTAEDAAGAPRQGHLLDAARLADLRKQYEREQEQAAAGASLRALLDARCMDPDRHYCPPLSIELLNQLLKIAMATRGGPQWGNAWLPGEWEVMEALAIAFERAVLPLEHGASIVELLATVLNCEPSRVSRWRATTCMESP